MGKIVTKKKAKDYRKKHPFAHMHPCKDLLAIDASYWWNPQVEKPALCPRCKIRIDVPRRNDA